MFWLKQISRFKYLSQRKVEPAFLTDICCETTKIYSNARRTTEAPGNVLKHVEEAEGVQRSS
ncbi:MAG: hypothetical protein A2161_18590 [Candidatus Schekmanbacteria bacterium RBG_13_48_7]|uniref:Uncharacterized protein n=1 Tax=Candidatus Schekmanbacteria bacterium RBG_13_48_7 TaxID=1817878 RepID=A0A1F7S223_9BACT|nr:MAG: hypothetical protein A2161_18590 [Candidatus Schekmanbacteria bacterium RBG_13_48_7]